MDANALSNFEIAKIYEFAYKAKMVLPLQIKEEILTEFSSSSSLINQSKTYHDKASTNDIKKYILSKISDTRLHNINHIDLISGKIHRELGLNNCMPSVCSVMRQAMGRHDTILKTTPSGNSSTITIRYITRD